MKKKVLSFLVVICMIVGMLPMIAMAAGQTNAVMEFATGVGTKDNSVLVPDEAAYFKVTAPDANGNTYLTKGDYASDYDVAYIYEEVPTLYLNGANIQNDLPFVLYAWDADTQAKVETDLKVVIEDDTVIRSTADVGGTDRTGDDPYNGNGAAIAMHPLNGTATITSVGDAKLTVSAVSPEDYSGIYGHQTGGSRGSVILVACGDVVLMNANIDVDFSTPADNLNYCPNGIGVYSGDMTINGGNLRVGLGLRADAYEMNSPLFAEAADHDADGVTEGGTIVFENGANVTILNDNAARPIRCDGDIIIRDANLEAASTATNRQIFRTDGGDVIFDFSEGVEYTAVGGKVVGSDKVVPVIDRENFTISIAEEDLEELTESSPNLEKTLYVKITVVANEEPVQLPSFAGTYMTLDVVNDIHFLIAKSDLEGLDIADLTAHFVMERHEGKADRVATVELEQDPNYADYYRAKFHDVAAAELCDEITVVLKDSEGNVVTEEFTITMGRALQKLYEVSVGEANAKWRNLSVALLNYGAAAQIAFNYNVTDLATKYLPEC